MIDLLIKRGKALRHRQRTCKDGGREGTMWILNGRWPRFSEAEEGGKDPYLLAFEELYIFTDFRLSVSRTMKV